MRKRNSLLAMLLAMVLTLGLTGPAFAAESKGYADVEKHWGKEYIDAVTEKGLIDGKTASSFAPDENMTRGDLVLALYRLAGKPAVTAVNPFTDVEGGELAQAVVWASSRKIVNGKNEAGTVFDPDGSVTRQEIAKILNLFAANQVKRDALTSRTDELSGYPDAAEIGRASCRERV